MKKIFVMLSIIISIITMNKQYNEILIPEESIRIRVIANSNSLEDQLTKIKVKENITNFLSNKLDNINTLEKARNGIKNNLVNIEKIVENSINNYDYEINYGNNYFPEKKLNGILYKEGYYESLVVNLGKAKGNNWWCVLFPPLCMVEATYKESDKIEYKSKILEILNTYK